MAADVVAATVAADVIAVAAVVSTATSAFAPEQTNPGLGAQPPHRCTGFTVTPRYELPPWA